MKPNPLHLSDHMCCEMIGIKIYHAPQLVGTWTVIALDAQHILDEWLILTKTDSDQRWMCYEAELPYKIGTA